MDKKTKLSNKLQQLKDRKNVRVEDLEDILGVKSRQAYNIVNHGTDKYEYIEKLSRFFNFDFFTYIESGVEQEYLDVEQRQSNPAQLMVNISFEMDLYDPTMNRKLKEIRAILSR